MKKIELLIGDHEYSQIQEIFEKEASFKPVDEKDQIIIKALSALISPKNLIEEDVGGVETYETTIKVNNEPEDKTLDNNTKYIL